MTVAMRDLDRAIQQHAAIDLGERLFYLTRDPKNFGGRAFAVAALRDAIVPPPNNLLPLMPVCDGSFACAVCDRDVTDPTLDEGEVFEVVRWHLGRISPERQGELLDIDPLLYLDSAARELRSRGPARQGVSRVAQEYYDRYVVNEERPRPNVLRPVQLACQNVIIGMATLRHDSEFDGLRVESYTTCDVPHLATGEADRAMAALLLCDAFQSGGTMEIRFGPAKKADKESRHNQKSKHRGELPVPPALRRYARVRGLELGVKDRCSIAPAEARELFLLVTPMSEELRFYALEAFDRGRISPERLCYALMAGIWKDIELTLLLGATSRSATILEGGSDPADRMARSAEAESCRAAVMIGTLLARLENGSEAPGSKAIKVDEDARVAVPWTIRPDRATAAFAIPSTRAIPWTTSVLASTKLDRDVVVVLPRPMPHPSDAELLASIQAEEPEADVLLLVPEDADMSAFSDVPWLRYPQTLDIIDQIVRGRLNTMRISRR